MFYKRIRKIIIPLSLHDANFINNNFRVIKWSAYHPVTYREKSVENYKICLFLLFLVPTKEHWDINLPILDY